MCLLVLSGTSGSTNQACHLTLPSMYLLYQEHEMCHGEICVLSLCHVRFDTSLADASAALAQRWASLTEVGGWGFITS